MSTISAILLLELTRLLQECRSGLIEMYDELAAVAAAARMKRDPRLVWPRPVAVHLPPEPQFERDGGIVVWSDAIEDSIDAKH